MQFKHPIPIPDPSMQDYRRFLRKCENWLSGCIIYKGSSNSRGYCVFKMQGKMYLAHRVSYRMFVGQIPESMTIHHTCNNPRCVNPKHLVPMTMLDNLQEANRRNHESKTVGETGCEDRGGANEKPFDQFGCQIDCRSRDCEVPF